MPPISANRSFGKMRRVKQTTPFHCGPAVLEMLASFYRISLTQDEIVQAAGAAQKIKTRGVTVEELAESTKKLAPKLSFWYKRYGTIGELSQIINTFKHPVGVEWQGVFDYDDEEIEEDEDDDPGHYGVITKINTHQNIVMIADPDKHYAGRDRRFTVLGFERRWWDINQTIDPFTKKDQEVDDYHMMFIVAPPKLTFPKTLNMSQI